MNKADDFEKVKMAVDNLQQTLEDDGWEDMGSNAEDWLVAYASDYDYLHEDNIIDDDRWVSSEDYDEAEETIKELHAKIEELEEIDVISQLKTLITEKMGQKAFEAWLMNPQERRGEFFQKLQNDLKNEIGALRLTAEHQHRRHQAMKADVALPMKECATTPLPKWTLMRDMPNTFHDALKMIMECENQRYEDNEKARQIISDYQSDLDRSLKIREETERERAGLVERLRTHLETSGRKQCVARGRLMMLKKEHYDKM
jgi:hypothetical protein